MVHAKQFDQPLVQITLVHTNDGLSIDRLQQVHELVRTLEAVVGNQIAQTDRVRLVTDLDELSLELRRASLILLVIE